MKLVCKIAVKTGSILVTEEIYITLYHFEAFSNQQVKLGGFWIIIQLPQILSAVILVN